ncbi:hypothetical protein D9M68_567610 [compost metagenome]
MIIAALLAQRTKERRNLSAAGGLNAGDERVIDLAHSVRLSDIVLESMPQMTGHFSVGHRSVRTPDLGQLQHIDECR